MVGPVGAIGNGVELIGLSGAGTDEIALLEEGAKSAAARLGALRLAFGAAPPGARIAGEALRDALSTYAAPPRTELTLALPESLPAPSARMATLAVMCLHRSVPHGGQIVLHAEESRWSATARSSCIKPVDWSLREDPAASIAARDVEFALLGRLSRISSQQLTITQTPDCVEVTLQ